jgi:ribosome-interacting GTPase 1
VLKQGSTILEVAEAVHKDIAAALKFARVWGTDTFDGQRVTRDYQVQDGDVIELHS